ncbi:MAG TPA: glycosyltransferase [Planctomycetes bacterium]|nr:glycosyltransferase [Planctomycetota bacterium]
MRRGPCEQENPQMSTLQTDPLAYAPTDRRIWLMGLPVDNLTMGEAIQQITGSPGQPPRMVFFVNAHCVNVALRNQDYRRLLQRADLVLPDGIGLKLAGMALGTPIRDNANGTDLFPPLCRALAASGGRIFLLGARPGVAEGVCAWANRHCPELVITGCHHGYFTRAEEPLVIEKIAQSGADLLFVAMGVPRQELWIGQHLESLGVRVALGVGGLFDFYSGRIPRAPLWMRRAGLEWLYRLIREPVRLGKRYLVGNPVFLGRVAWYAWRRGARRRPPWQEVPGPMEWPVRQARGRTGRAD